MKRNPWPYAIIAFFAVFISAMASWITFAVRNDMQLVRPDYYDHEIRYQEQIDKITRTRPFRAEVGVTYNADRGNFTIRLPAAHASAAGEIHFYRPSDSRLDQKVKLALRDSGMQSVAAARLAPGLWRVRVYWNSDGADFYHDEAVIVSHAK